MSTFEAIAAATFLSGFLVMAFVSATSAQRVPFHLGLDGKPGYLANRWVAFAVYQSLAAFFVYVAFTTPVPPAASSGARAEWAGEFTIVAAIAFIEVLHFGMWAVAGRRWPATAVVLTSVGFMVLLLGVAFAGVHS